VAVRRRGAGQARSGGGRRGDRGRNTRPRRIHARRRRNTARPSTGGTSDGARRRASGHRATAAQAASARSSGGAGPGACLRRSQRFRLSRPSSRSPMCLAQPQRQSRLPPPRSRSQARTKGPAKRSLPRARSRAQRSRTPTRSRSPLRRSTSMNLPARRTPFPTFIRLSGRRARAARQGARRVECRTGRGRAAGPPADTHAGAHELGARSGGRAEHRALRRHSRGGLSPPFRGGASANA
jgi:hypothetical protein